MAWALAGLSPDLGTLARVERLRALLPGEAAREAALQVELRGRARGRFPGAERLFFTAKGLQQASDRRVAAARARRISACDPTALVLDGTAGLGGDAIALATEGLRVVAADADPALVPYLRANLAALGLRPWAVAARAESPPVVADVLVLDPDRRARGERSLDPARWSPAWSSCARLVGAVRGACVKLAPALDPARVEGGLPADLARCWQWVSLGGELKELALWTGSLVPEGTAPCEALALAPVGTRGEGADEASIAGVPREAAALSPEEAAGVAWIAEPDPAVIRSGLVGNLAADQGLAPLGPRLAYLGGAERPRSPLLRTWRVVAGCNADPRRVRALLNAHGIGPVMVSRRGHPESAEVLVRRYRGSGERKGRVLVARLARGHRAYLVERTDRR